MEQQDGQNGNGQLPQNLDLNSMPTQFDPHFLQQMDANAMPGVMNGQFVGDLPMGDLPIGGDPNMLLSMMMANGNGSVPMQPNTVSADEIALYDRQIRLWGIDAQAKIQNANILLITMRGLATEVAKNLVLAGIGSLTVLDDAAVTEADLGAGFFLSEAQVGQNRAEAASEAIRKLNPRVNVNVDVEGVKVKGPSYFAGFDIVIATDLDPDSYNLINTATRLNSKAFYAAGVHGMYGYIFSDLIEHDYVIERDVGNVPTQLKHETQTRVVIHVQTKKDGPKTVEAVTKRELYSTWFLASDLAILPQEYTKSKRRLRAVSPALSCLRALWEFSQLHGGRLPGSRDDLKAFTQIATQKHKFLSLPPETLDSEFLRKFLQGLGSEIAPVTAILGGQLAQDVINVLGQKQQPIQNMVIFDGNTMESLMFPLHPEGQLGASLLSLGVGVGSDGMQNGDNMAMMGMEMNNMAGMNPAMGLLGNGMLAGMDAQMGGADLQSNSMAPQNQAPLAQSAPAQDQSVAQPQQTQLQHGDAEDQNPLRPNEAEDASKADPETQEPGRDEHDKPATTEAAPKTDA